LYFGMPPDKKVYGKKKFDITGVPAIIEKGRASKTMHDLYLSYDLNNCRLFPFPTFTGRQLFHLSLTLLFPGKCRYLDGGFSVRLVLEKESLTGTSPLFRKP
jgi:hypothetical protein